MVAKFIKSHNKVTGDSSLRSAVQKEFESSDYRTNRVFSLGDLWTGSILVSKNGQRIRLIDFEFAGEGKPLQDLAQFGSITINSLYTVSHVDGLCRRRPSAFTDDDEHRRIEFINVHFH